MQRVIYGVQTDSKAEKRLGGKKMKLQKTKATAITLILMLTSIAFTVALQPANAVGESPSNPIISNWNTYLFCMVAPNPVGVGQTVLVNIQLDKTSPTATAFNRGDLFDGFTATITKPDGTVETKGPYKSWPTSGTFFYYTPNSVGEYTFQAHFPGQWINGSYLMKSAMFSVTWSNMSFGPPPPLTYETLYCKPSDSAAIKVTVQQEQIAHIPNNPLPTDYWTRPINAENKGWSEVADDWLMQSYDKPGRMFTAGNAFSPYASAPNSAHLLWNRPIEIGGLAGGVRGDSAYYTGLSYEQFYTPIIIQGQIIYQDHGPTGTTTYGSRCLDLYTGKELWYMNNTNINFAQVLEIDTPNEHGPLPYLWNTGTGGGFFAAPSTTWYMYDAFSADDDEVPRLVLTVANVTTGTTRFGPNGEILNFALSGAGANQRLICWNSTRAIYRPGSIDVWSPSGTFDGRVGIEFNVSAPTTATGTLTISDVNVKEGLLLASITDSNVYPRVMVDSVYRIPKQDSSGQYPTTANALWIQNRTNIESVTTFTTFIQDGVYARFQGSLLTVYCYDALTGSQKWEVGPITENGWAYFTYLCANAYGKIYLSGYDGHVRAYNHADGSLAWDYYFGDAGYENAYGTWPTYNGFTIADGKIFIANDEHSSDSVLWRGGRLWAIDTTTGAGVWNLSGWLRNTAVADGYLTSYNCLDGQVYVIGKGPSKTTVTASPKIIPKGTAVMIEGTVMDQSPGQPDTPCISDESQAAWMEYLHMQKQIPGDATGVPVKLTAIAPNGNSVDIGTATSDMAGNFGLMWTPNSEGQYQIMATFEGTDSYGSSYATTYLGVGAAAPSPSATSPPTTQPPPTTPPATETPTPTPSPTTAPPPGGIPIEQVYLITAAIVVIAAVAAAAVILRRRK